MSEEVKAGGEVMTPDVKTEESKKPELQGVFIKQEKTDKPYWYVIHTYSGYENKVKMNLEKAIVNHGFQDLILEVKVPMEESIEVKNGKKKHIMKKMYPGYVMVKMILDDETWYVVRNTRGVTGFVGPGSRPIPLTDKEVRAMGVENIPIKLSVEVGENVMVTSGPLESFIGIIKEVNPERQKVKVVVSMFGRDTLVDLDFVQIKRI
jgi:transcription termination/antitermination protein NusG